MSTPLKLINSTGQFYTAFWGQFLKNNTVSIPRARLTSTLGNLSITLARLTPAVGKDKFL